MNHASKANEAVTLAFYKSRWACNGLWISYDAISTVVTRDIEPTLKKRTIERSCRDLAQKGVLESNRKGMFRWRI